MYKTLLHHIRSDLFPQYEMLSLVIPSYIYSYVVSTETTHTHVLIRSMHIYSYVLYFSF